MDGIHSWWDRLPGERFWLGVTRPESAGVLLAAPCARGRGEATEHPLIRYVRDGDVVFHYDPDQAAIVAWSLACGEVHRTRLAWVRPGRTQDDEPVVPPLSASWAVGLDDPVPLDSFVFLDCIAGIQSEHFLALRSLEDEVGTPLYYPFAIGDPSDTHLLPGYVFKLPVLFVEACPALARAAEQVRWFGVAPARVAATNGAGAGRFAPSPARSGYASGAPATVVARR